MSLLPDAEAFKQLADGTRRGAWPTLARGGLAALAVPYGLVVSARNAAYDRGLLRVTAAPVPVISVGNLTLGGIARKSSLQASSPCPHSPKLIASQARSTWL